MEKLINKPETENETVKHEGINAEFSSTKTCTLLLVISMLGILCAIAVLSHIRYMYFALICAVSFGLAFVGMILGYRTYRQKLSIEDGMINATTLLGTEMYLPLNEITAVGSGAFGCVIVTTRNYKLYSFFVKNNKQIVSEITKYIHE